MDASHPPLSEREEHIAQLIVDAAFAVHKALGPGLLEHVYEVCFCHELTKRGVAVRRQVVVSIEYDGIRFDEGLRLDVLVEDLVICELKASVSSCLGGRSQSDYPNMPVEAG